MEMSTGEVVDHLEAFVVVLPSADREAEASTKMAVNSRQSMMMLSYIHFTRGLDALELLYKPHPCWLLVCLCGVGHRKGVFSCFFAGEQC
jgi:hypothetical protein